MAPALSLTAWHGMRAVLVSLCLGASVWPAYRLLFIVMACHYGDGLRACLRHTDRVAFRYGLVVALSAVLCFWLMQARHDAWQWLCFGYLMALLCLCDIQLRLLPDALLAMLLGVACLGVPDGSQPPRVVALALMVALYAVGRVAVAIGRALMGAEALGRGDIKLIAVLAVWFPYEQLPLVLLVASFAGLVYILAMRLHTGATMRTIAFGPCLACGALAVHLATRAPPAAPCREAAPVCRHPDSRGLVLFQERSHGCSGSDSRGGLVQASQR